MRMCVCAMLDAHDLLGTLNISVRHSFSSIMYSSWLHIIFVSFEEYIKDFSLITISLQVTVPSLSNTVPSPSCSIILTFLPDQIMDGRIR